MENVRKGMGGVGASSVIKRRNPLSTDSLVKVSSLLEETDLILLIEPAIPGVDLVEWTNANIGYINQKLLKHGALLFRGFGLKGDDGILRYLNGQPFKLIEYVERSSPRKSIAKNVFTSTLYPSDETIALHNENTASISFALKVWFYCTCASEWGGETPVADARKILARIDPDVADKFRKLGWLLTRNYGKYLAYDWKDAFAGRSKEEVEKYCKDNQIDMQWMDDGGLRTKQRRSATLFHPVSQEEAWFNHIAFWHKANLPPAVLESMLQEVGPEGLPFDTFYGDGTPIPDDIAIHLRDAYLKEKFMFPWQNGDLMLIDNIITSHGREKFSGAREIRVAMGEEYTRPLF